jgi:hypothetical protein
VGPPAPPSQPPGDLAMPPLPGEPGFEFEEPEPLAPPSSPAAAIGEPIPRLREPMTRRTTQGYAEQGLPARAISQQV